MHLASNHFSALYRVFMLQVVQQRIHQFVEPVAELLVCHGAVVQIDEREGNVTSLCRKDLEERLFTEAVALAGEALDPVAVDRMVQLALGRDDKHLAGHIERRLGEPLHTVREYAQSTSFSTEPFHQLAAAQMFRFGKALVHVVALLLETLTAGVSWRPLSWQVPWWQEQPWGVPS